MLTDEQKAGAVRTVGKSDKSIHQVAEEMGLRESALRRWQGLKRKFLGSTRY